MRVGREGRRGRWIKGKRERGQGRKAELRLVQKKEERSRAQ